MTDSEADFVYRYDAPTGPDLPTILLLHSTGGDEHDLIPLGQMILPGAGLLSPRGKVLEQGMSRYFRRLAVGVFDLDDLRRRTDELATFIVSAAREHGFDPARVWAAGYSNGANISASLLLSHPTVLAGALLFHAQLPFEPAEQPDLDGVPSFLTGGRTDAMVPVAQTERLADVLRSSGADVTMHWERGGHALVRPEVAAAHYWLARQFLAQTEPRA